MDKNYTVVETSKIAAVRAGHLYSLITDVDVENGHIGYVGDLAADVEGLETHEFLAPTADLIGIMMRHGVLIRLFTTTLMRLIVLSGVMI